MRKITGPTHRFLLIVSLVLAFPLNAVELEAADCLDFINESHPAVTCAFVTLPLDHHREDPRTVRLPILIAHSTQSRSAPSSHAILIPGAGGPGASMGFGYRYHRGEFLQPYDNLLQAGYDVVILDQRGAGLSSPRVTCFEAIDVFRDLITRERNLEDEIQRYEQSARQCRARLHEQGIDRFDTAQSAQDFLSVMAALNYDWWGTIATSYATAIAQTMLTIKADAFDKVVLDSPVPLDHQKPMTKESTYASVRKSIDRCQLTHPCRQQYPELSAAFDRIVSSARTTPFRLSISPVDSAFINKKTILIIDDDTLLAMLANAIYSNEGIATLPSVVTAIAKGRLQALRPIAEDFWYQSTDDTYADGLNLTVHCKERLLLENQYIRANPGYLPSLSEDSRRLLQAQSRLCDIWAVPQARPKTMDEKISAPVLLVSGSLDPVISSEDINNTADDFANVTGNHKITGAGHAVWFQSECVRAAITLFFDHGTAEALKQCELDIPQFK